jgi:hypothetical protein
VVRHELPESHLQRHLNLQGQQQAKHTGHSSHSSPTSRAMAKPPCVVQLMFKTVKGRRY